MKSTVVFDIGSTLIHPNFNTLTSLAGLENANIDIQILSHAFTYALEADQRVLPIGDQITRQGMELLRLLDLNSSYSTSEAREIWLRINNAGGYKSILYTELDPDAHEVLLALRNSGCFLIAASNSDGTLKEELKQFDIAQYFDSFIDSYDIGFEKPDSRFFDHVLSIADQDNGKKETWYIGNDLVRDLLGSLIAGFSHAVFYDRVNAYPKFRTKYRLTKLNDLLPLIFDTGNYGA